ncbi:MAG: endonuclease/exonuclease/phosphatase family protein, partial [Paludibacteraceae bacterium]|nr:endonuclease/exonuclease/phosphatase family protein [Paludibacteraceae bacterium]
MSRQQQSTGRRILGLSLLTVKHIIKWICAGITICITASMMMADLSTIVSPETWILPAYFGLIFPVLLLLDVLCILLWIPFNKKWSLIPLFGLLISFFPVRNTLGTPFGNTDYPDDTHRLNVLTYNILGYKNLSRDNTEFFDALNAMDADLICMQEFAVATESGRALQTETEVCRRLERYPYHYIHYALRSKYLSSGTAIFSKHPIIAHQVIFSSRFNSASWADIVVDADTIRIFNCHLESNQFSVNDYDLKDELAEKDVTDAAVDYASRIAVKMKPAYIMRAQQADSIMHAIEATSRPAIVCGDFNDVPVGYAYSTIR